MLPSIIKGENIPEPGIPESFKVLLKELQSLALDVRVLDQDNNEVKLLESSEYEVTDFKKVLDDGGYKRSSRDEIVIIDADLQDPPESIPDMVKLWEAGNEVIYGKRKSRKGESYFKLFTAKMFYKTLNALSDVEIPQDTGDFRLVDRKVVDTINKLPEHKKF